MTIEERAAAAAELKATGKCNCAQAVLKVFEDKLPVDDETLMKLSAGYAAGMGCICKVRCKKCARTAKVRCIFCGYKVGACCRCTELPRSGQNTGASYFGLKPITCHNIVLTLRF